MKAITLYDPWATLVVLGEKKFETRSWSTSYRGLLAIHVSKKFTVEMHELWETWERGLCPALKERTLWPPKFGCIIGTVEVVGMHRAEALRRRGLTIKELTFGNFDDGRWAWELQNPQRLTTPVPCRGSMGIWTVPPEIAESVLVLEKG